MEEKNKFKNLSAKGKVLKIAKVGAVASKVFYIASIVGSLVLAICAIVLPLIKIPNSPLTPAELAIGLGGAALYFFMLINVWWNVEQIFKNISLHKTPFNEKVTHYLKKTAVAVILVALIPSLIGSILLHIFAPESEIDFDFQYIGLGVGVILFMLSLVFNYGIELQNKDDETL